MSNQVKVGFILWCFLTVATVANFAITLGFHGFMIGLGLVGMSIYGKYFFRDEDK